MTQLTSQRTRCRLPCTITIGRRRIHARVLDVSEQGLCIVTPVRFDERTTVDVVIDAPRVGPVAVQGVVRYKRPFRQPSSGRRGWATGLQLSKVGPEFMAIANPEHFFREAKPRAALDIADAGSELLDESIEIGDPGSLQVFRVRLKQVGSTRMRVLTLDAPSEQAVREAVLTDLQGEWEIIGVEVNPLD